MNSPTDDKNPHGRNPHILVGRLNAGWLMVERETDPQRKERLEDHWIHVLRQYEQACEGDISPGVEEVAA